MNLYDAGATTFTSQGYGSLEEDAIESFTTTEVNGVSELEFTYSVNGRRFEEIQNNMIVTCENQDGGTQQPYRIYKISKPLNGKIKINCQHISYDLLGIPVAPCSAVGISAALNALKNNALITHSFTVWTDVSNETSRFNQTTVKSFRESLMGTKGSILDTFHGSSLEFEFDGLVIKAHSHLGQDRGVTIEYGKNMTSLKCVEDATKFYTGCVAFWTDRESGECVWGNVAYSSNYESFAVQKIYNLDASADFEEKPTANDLTQRAAQYVTDNEFGIPKVTIDVSFVNLADSPEYAYLKNLVRVKLGDTVTVYHRDYNVSYKAEVIKTVWDHKKKRYRSITIGSKSSSISSTLKQAVTEALEPQIEAVESALSSAVKSGTERLRGGLGGYVVINYNANNVPNEILIMDSPSIATATNVIRMNAAGIGFSTTGYDGEYRTAWTIDGTLYADFITAGVLNGALIEAGSVQTASLNVDAQDVVNGYIENIKTDTDGLHISQIDPSTKAIIGAYQSLFSESGMRVIDNTANKATLIAEGDSVTAENFTANNFLIIDAGDYKARFQEFSNSEDSEQMGCFWIGG